mgnify:FL=1
MKKLLLVAFVTIIIATLSSCRRDYECCYLDADGSKLGSGTGNFGCATSRRSKKEAEEIEAEFNLDASSFGGSAKCEKN